VQGQRALTFDVAGDPAKAAQVLLHIVDDPQRPVAMLRSGYSTSWFTYANAASMPLV
jgi:hypothetical protein